MQYLVSYCLYYVLKNKTSKNSVKMEAYLNGYFVIFGSWVLYYIVGVCICSLFCCTLLYIDFSFAFILMGIRELIALLSLSSWCLVIAVPLVCLQFVIVVLTDHNNILFC